MKRQKWLTGILTVMLVASFLLAVGSFVAVSSAQASPPGPRDPCAYFDCDTWQGTCACASGYLYCSTTIHHCCYNPYPEACSRCPSPCCWWWCQCYDWPDCHPY